MKKIILILIVITTTSCANKPQMLSAANEVNESNFCTQLTTKTEQKQSLYKITGFKSEIHQYNKHYYYYYLKDYLSGKCLSGEPVAIIEDTKVGIVFQTYSKGRSYLKLLFNVRIGVYQQNEFRYSKTYQTTSDTEIMSFLEGNGKQAMFVSEALAKGYKDILRQVSLDLNKAQNLPVP